MDFDNLSITNVDELLNQKIENLTIEIRLTFPKDVILVKQLDEITEEGFSFSMLENEGFFEKGVILNDIKIFDREREFLMSKIEVEGKESIEDEGIIKHKIKCKFLEYKNDLKNILRKRQKRFSINTIKNMTSKVFFIFNDEINRAELINFSKSGALILLKRSRYIFSKGDILKDFSIYIGEEKFYSGNAEIIEVINKINDIEIRVFIKAGDIPINKILDVSNVNRLDFVINKIKKEVSGMYDISKEYIHEVSELSYKLRILKKFLDDFEKSIKDEDQVIKQKILNDALNLLEKEFFDDITKHLYKINDLVKNIDVKDEIYKKYLTYFQNELNEYLFLSPFINRIYYKPLGYAGDYEMMNMIYANIPRGESLFAKILDKYTLEIPVAQANRNRIPYMLGKIKTIGKKVLEKKDRIKIASIACGPCLEIQELLKKEEISNYIDFTLLDSSNDALLSAKNKLEEIKKEYHRETTFKFINESIYPLIKNKEFQNMLDDNQDIIYSLGLFEYLSDITVTRLIKVLYNKISDDGVLIVGNYDDKNKNKSYMELGGEWFLFYREPNKMISFTKDLSSCQASVEDDKEIEFNTFLNIKKLN